GHRKTTVFGTIAAIGISLALIPSIGAEFIPASDQGQIEIRVETPSGTNLKSTEEVVAQINETLSGYEEILETNFLTVGGGGFSFSTTSNQASYMIQLVPSDERDMTTTELVKELDRELKQIAGAEITVMDMTSGMGMGNPVQIQLNGPEHEVLQELGEQVVYLISDI